MENVPVDLDGPGKLAARFANLRQSERGAGELSAKSLSRRCAPVAVGGIGQQVSRVEHERLLEPAERLVAAACRRCGARGANRGQEGFDIDQGGRRRDEAISAVRL